jgi:integrase
MALTDAACRNATAEGRPFKRHADGGGLYLEVTASGSKLWRWKYRFAGKEKRLALGQYPAVGLAAARRKRDEARELLRAGTDPGTARREAKRQALVSAEGSFESVARRWWADWKVDKTKRHAGYVLRRLECDAFPELGPRPVAELAAPDFVRMAKKIEARGTAELPRRVLETCGQVMRYAVAHGLAERNPVADVKPGDVLKPRRVENYARVGADELPELLRKIEVYDGSPYTRMAMKLLALTFVRTGELIGARWQEFDLAAAEWRIPAERTKKRRLHLVPLSRQAVEVLTCLQALRGAAHCTGQALVFPGERDHERPMSNNTILRALERMGYGKRMTGHGWRGVASTVLNEAGFRADVIEAQLAHVQESRVRAAYNHAQHLVERRELMQAWADFLDAIRRSGKVLPFRQARAAKVAA